MWQKKKNKTGKCCFPSCHQRPHQTSHCWGISAEWCLALYSLYTSYFSYTATTYSCILSAVEKLGIVFFKSLEGIICPVVNVSSQSWFNRYIYYWNVQFLNIKIISLRHIWPWPCLAILIRSCCFLIPNDVILFDIFPNVGYHELLVLTKLDIYVFIFWIDTFCVTK